MKKTLNFSQPFSTRRDHIFCPEKCHPMDEKDLYFSQPFSTWRDNILCREKCHPMDKKDLGFFSTFFKQDATARIFYPEKCHLLFLMESTFFVVWFNGFTYQKHLVLAFPGSHHKQFVSSFKSEREIRKIREYVLYRSYISQNNQQNLLFSWRLY